MYVVYIVIKLLIKFIYNKNISYCLIVIDYENDIVLCYCIVSCLGFMFYIRVNFIFVFDNFDFFFLVNFIWK